MNKIGIYEYIRIAFGSCLWDIQCIPAYQPYGYIFLNITPVILKKLNMYNLYIHVGYWIGTVFRKFNFQSRKTEKCGKLSDLVKRISHAIGICAPGEMISATTENVVVVVFLVNEINTLSQIYCGNCDSWTLGNS